MTYYAIQAITEDNQKLLCWEHKKHLYFAEPHKGNGKLMTTPAPTLFSTKKSAKEAIDNVPSKGGNIKQFIEVVEAKKVNIVKVSLNKI